MAHDNQIAAERTSGTSEASKPSKTFSDIVADWLTVYATVYREQPTEELTIAYSEALKDIRLDLLHQAFLHAMKRLKFRPTPAEVRESSEIVGAESWRNRPKYLDEPRLSLEEREAAVREFPLRPATGETRVNYAVMAKEGFGMPHTHPASCLCAACRERRAKQP